jgi:hypothetical protein
VIASDSSITTQRRLNFEMLVKNLYKSTDDRERVPKIQGLLNECVTFLDDELSIISAAACRVAGNGYPYRDRARPATGRPAPNLPKKDSSE